jgi:2-oxoglutarate ferredoxin oxidoreductase subunit gamma
MRIDIIIQGIGGQGALTAGQLLITAGLEEVAHVSLVPYYTPEVRGGQANAMLVLSDEPIGCVLPAEWDVAILMAGRSSAKVARRARPGGFVLYNSTLVEEPDTTDGVTRIGIPASEIACKLGNVRVANMVLLGALCAYWKTVSVDALKSAVRSRLTGLRERFVGTNLAAIDAGIQAIRQACARPMASTA